MAVLTDGQEWHFYLPAEQGDYQERRVYKLDIVERDPDECERRFRRYLAYDLVCTGEAYANARSDYQSVRRQREAEAALPEAWQQLVHEPDELLIELLGDQVESLCGYRPDPDAVAEFLSNRLLLREGTRNRTETPQPPDRPARRPTRPSAISRTPASICKAASSVRVTGAIR
jgi:hypothetical protein